MSNCPRCKKTHYKTFVINRYSKKMPIQKCLVCGNLWIFDADLIDLSRAEAKKMFIETLISMGKDDGKNRTG